MTGFTTISTNSKQLKTCAWNGFRQDKNHHKEMGPQLSCIMVNDSMIIDTVWLCAGNNTEVPAITCDYFIIIGVNTEVPVNNAKKWWSILNIFVNRNDANNHSSRIGTQIKFQKHANLNNWAWKQVISITMKSKVSTCHAKDFPGGIGLAASSLNLVDVVWMLPFLVGTAGRVRDTRNRVRRSWWSPDFKTIHCLGVMGRFYQEMPFF